MQQAHVAGDLLQILLHGLRRNGGGNIFFIVDARPHAHEQRRAHRAE